MKNKVRKFQKEPVKEDAFEGESGDDFEVESDGDGASDDEHGMPGIHDNYDAFSDLEWENNADEMLRGDI